VRLLLRSSLVTALVVGAAAGPWAGGAAAATTMKVRVLEVQGPIDRPLRADLERRLADAERAGAIVVLQLNTPGALGQGGVALAERVAGLDVPVIAWVGPVPARASGAGLLLLLASSLPAVSPGAQTGPLRPVDVLHPDEDPPGLEAAVERWLAERGREDVDLDALDRPLTAQAAIDAGVIEATAYTVPELLRAIDGRTVSTPQGEVELATRVATSEQEAGERTVDVRFEEPGLITRVLHAVGTPSMVYVFLVLGLAGLAFELTQPGFGFAGFCGIGLLALAAYGLTVAIPNAIGIALLLVGIGLLVLDVRLRSLSWPTWFGLAAFAAGSVLAWRHVDASVRISPWLIGGAVVATFLYYGFALTVALQSRDRIVGVQRGLVGLVGEARGRLAPDGPVFVKGALWRGRSGGEPIEAGTAVRVRGVDGLILRVEPEDAGAAVPEEL
jgi:membrane-bound serine protease (ClpP class)